MLIARKYIISIVKVRYFICPTVILESSINSYKTNQRMVTRSLACTYSRRYSNHRHSAIYLVSQIHLAVGRVVCNVPWSYTNSNCIDYDVIGIYHRDSIRIWFSAEVGYIYLEGRGIVCNTTWMIAN